MKIYELERGDTFVHTETKVVGKFIKMDGAYAQVRFKEDPEEKSIYDVNNPYDLLWLGEEVEKL